jgi:hypothetical protein
MCSVYSKNDSNCRVPDAIKFASTCSVSATSAAAFVVAPPVTNVSAVAAARWSVLTHHSCSIFVLAATIAWHKSGCSTTARSPGDLSVIIRQHVIAARRLLIDVLVLLCSSTSFSSGRRPALKAMWQETCS